MNELWRLAGLAHELSPVPKCEGPGAPRVNAELVRIDPANAGCITRITAPEMEHTLRSAPLGTPRTAQWYARGLTPVAQD
jgi:hypothetical protein